MPFIETVTSMRKYNDGFKTLKGIGKHVQIPHFLFNFTTRLSTKLIYGYLKSYVSKENGTARISNKKLVKRTWYGDNKITDAIGTLARDGLIIVNKHPTRTGNIHYEFIFPSLTPDSGFERITDFFLDHKLLSKQEKEFIFAINLKLLPNDCIGSLEKPAKEPKVIVKWFEDEINSVLSESTVKRRLSSLQKKGFVSKKFSRTSGGYEPEWTGYQFNMDSIMFEPDSIKTLRAKMEHDKIYKRK